MRAPPRCRGPRPATPAQARPAGRRRPIPRLRRRVPPPRQASPDGAEGERHHREQSSHDERAYGARDRSARDQVSVGYRVWPAISTPTSWSTESRHARRRSHRVAGGIAWSTGARRAVLRAFRRRPRRPGSETPVEQGGGLIPVGRAAFLDESVHHGDDEAPTVALRRADEGLAGRVGETRLPPSMPGYRNSISSWLTRFTGPESPGNGSDGEDVMAANAGFAMAARKITARSCGVVYPSMPGPLSPDGEPARVPLHRGPPPWHSSSTPRRRLPPSMCASVLAASLPETSSSPCRLLRGVRPAGLDPGAVALHLRVGLRCDDRGIEREFVEHDEREQRLDGAGRWMGDVLVAACEDLTGVHVGDDPRRRGASGIGTVPTG